MVLRTRCGGIILLTDLYTDTELDGTGMMMEISARPGTDPRTGSV